MSSALIYRTLVPDAPLYRRTEGDESRGSLFTMRARTAGLLRGTKVTPGLQKPTLVSSFEGSIDRILFSFPSWAAGDPALVQAYRSVINSLRRGTRFVVVHHESAKKQIAPWFSSAGHRDGDVLFVAIPDYVSLTDWAEDAYVSVKDGTDGSAYLMEPWEFKRAGDALIADAVEEFAGIKAQQAPLIFQGGNCLIGSDFWLLGKDYFADTVDLLGGPRPPVRVPDDVTPEEFARQLFSKYVDEGRKLVVVGTKKPIPIRDYVGTKDGRSYYLDIASGGAGTFQPIFHIDMFLTLVGVNAAGAFEVLVGDPSLADKILGTKSPFALQDVYDDVAQSLTALGFAVTRNPLVHRGTVRNTTTLSELRNEASQPGYEALMTAVKELAAAGASNATKVRVRDWHHITWNNCLVERSAAKGKHVYLPTFGHGQNRDLKSIDAAMAKLWTSLDFTVHQLGDFNKFAERQGVVHCIKKYLTRGK